MAATAASFAASAALVGCDAVTEPVTEPVADAVRIEVTGTATGEDGERIITFTVTNTGDTVAYVATCGERLLSVVERKVTEAWQRYSGDFCPAVNPIEHPPLAPGSVEESERGVWSPGRYRLQVTTVRDRGLDPRFSPPSESVLVE